MSGKKGNHLLLLYNEGCTTSLATTLLNERNSICLVQFWRFGRCMLLLVAKFCEPCLRVMRNH